MAHLERCVATLRISGDDLDPEEISRLLGAQPTHAQRKGQDLQLSSGRTRTARFGMWRLAAPETSPEDFDRQAKVLLGPLTDDLAVWRDISARFEIDLFCGWFMGSRNEGVSIDADTLRLLGERGIELAVDLYAPDAVD